MRLPSLPQKPVMRLLRFAIWPSSEHPPDKRDRQTEREGQGEGNRDAPFHHVTHLAKKEHATICSVHSLSTAEPSDLPSRPKHLAGLQLVHFLLATQPWAPVSYSARGTAGYRARQGEPVGGCSVVAPHAQRRATLVAKPLSTSSPAYPAWRCQTALRQH